MNIRKSSLAGLLLAGIISMFCSCSPTTGSAGPDNIILLSGNATGIKCQMPVSIGDVATDIGTKSIRFSEALAPGRITDMQVYEDYSFLQDDMGRIFCIEDDSIVNVLCLSADGADSTRILSCTYSPSRKTLYVTKENEAAILCYSVPSFRQTGTLDITGYDKKITCIDDDLLIFEGYKNSYKFTSVAGSPVIPPSYQSYDLYRYRLDTGAMDSINANSMICYSMFSTRCISRDNNGTYISLPGFISRAIQYNAETLEDAYLVQFGDNRMGRLHGFPDDKRNIFYNDLAYMIGDTTIAEHYIPIGCNLFHCDNDRKSFWIGDNRESAQLGKKDTLSSRYLYAICNEDNLCMEYTVFIPVKENGTFNLKDFHDIVPLCMHDGYTYCVFQGNRQELSALLNVPYPCDPDYELAPTAAVILDLAPEDRSSLIVLRAKFGTRIMK